MSRDSFRAGGLLDRLRSLDLRFADAVEEESFKADREMDLLRWMLLGTAVGCISTVTHGLTSIGPRHFGEILRFNVATEQSRIVVCQQVIWTVVPAVWGVLIFLRLSRGWFHCWNWELLITGMMVYGAFVIIAGQTFYLTIMLGEDPSLVWESTVLHSHEAWALLGLNTVTTATSFFLPIRSIVSWTVPSMGVVTYAFVNMVAMEDLDVEHWFRTLLLIALSYLAWHGAWRTERHIRTEWSAVRQVVLSSCTIEEQQASIRNKGQEIERKELEIQEKDELARSLQTVSRALCDTMVQLDASFCMRSTDAGHGKFFEQQIEGALFTDFLSSEDKARFLSCTTRARESQLPELLPVTLRRRYTTSEVHLLLVDRGTTSLRYMLGIRIERDHPPTAPLELAGDCEQEEDQNVPWTPERRSFQGQEEAPGNAGNGGEDPMGPSISATAPPEEVPCLPPPPLPGCLSDSEYNSPDAAVAAAPETGAGAGGGEDRGGAAAHNFSAVLPTAAAPAAAAPAAGAAATAMQPIDENAESDFSFTTYPKNQPPRRIPKPTCVQARARTIRMVLKRWYVPRDNTSCCHYHTVLESIEDSIDCLFKEKCQPLFSAFQEQCPRCSCMNHGAKCVVCGYAPPELS